MTVFSIFRSRMFFLFLDSNESTTAHSGPSYPDLRGFWGLVGLQRFCSLRRVQTNWIMFQIRVTRWRRRWIKSVPRVFPVWGRGCVLWTDSSSLSFYKQDAMVQMEDEVSPTAGSKLRSPDHWMPTLKGFIDTWSSIEPGPGVQRVQDFIQRNQLVTVPNHNWNIMKRRSNTSELKEISIFVCLHLLFCRVDK